MDNQSLRRCLGTRRDAAYLGTWAGFLPYTSCVILQGLIECRKQLSLHISFFSLEILMKEAQLSF
jgi:hypothetical protein